MINKSEDEATNESTLLRIIWDEWYHKKGKNNNCTNK